MKIPSINILVFAICFHKLFSLMAMNLKDLLDFVTLSFLN